MTMDICGPPILCLGSRTPACALCCWSKRRPLLQLRQAVCGKLSGCRCLVHVVSLGHGSEEATKHPQLELARMFFPELEVKSKTNF